MAHGEYADARGRNFSFVQKVENLPEDWERRLRDKCIPMAYIVHDKDVYTQREINENEYLQSLGKVAGELKDPHVHFFAYFSGKKTASSVAKLYEDFGIEYVELVAHKNAKLAYFLHIGIDEKYQYAYDELKAIGGLKINYADLEAVDFNDVLDYANENGIQSFSVLVKEIRRRNPPLFRYVVGHYSLVCAYFADVREEEK